MFLLAVDEKGRVLFEGAAGVVGGGVEGILRELRAVRRPVVWCVRVALEMLDGEVIQDGTYSKVVGMLVRIVELGASLLGLVLLPLSRR